MRPWNLVATTTPSRLPPAKRLPDDLLRLALRVDVGGVDEVDPGVEGSVDDADRVVVIAVPPGAEHHRAETQRADLHARATEAPILHAETLG
jgi:hypothetical protein